MKIVFISGVNVLLNDGLYDEENFNINEEIMVIYFANIDLSYDYAKQFIKNKNLLYLFNFEIFFTKKPLDLYSFSICDYTITVNKNLSGVLTSFSPFKSDSPSLEEFILQEFFSNKYSLLLKNQWNLPMFIFYLNKYFYFILTFMLLFFSIISYKLLNYNSINLEKKEEIYKIFFS